MRRDNLRIIGLEEDEDEEEILKAKTIEVAADIGVTVEPSDISNVHCVGRPGDRSKPVIVRLCHWKKRKEMCKKK